MKPLLLLGKGAFGGCGWRPHTLRVAWDMQLAGRDQTGTGVYAKEMIRALQQRADVCVLALTGWQMVGRRSTMAGRLLRNAADVLWTHAGLVAAARSQSVDIVHAPANVAPIVGGRPFVVTVHDTVFGRFPQQYARWWATYMAWLMPNVFRQSAAVVTSSEHSRQCLVQEYGVPERKVHVIYPGIDHARYHPDTGDRTEAVMAHYGIKRRYVLHVGALVERKNIPLLLEAAALLKQQGLWGDRQVVLAGPTSPGMPGVERVKATATALGLADDVVLTGYVPADWLPSLYVHAEALALPSLYEGFGFPLVEAMATGTPVVALAGSSITEVVGEAAVLVPHNDSGAFAAGLEALLGNPQLGAQLRERGLQRAGAFTWERAADQLVAIYRRVGSARSGQPPHVPDDWAADR